MQLASQIHPGSGNYFVNPLHRLFEISNKTQEQIKCFLKHVKRITETTKPELQRQYLQALVEKIVVNHDEKKHIFTM